MVLWRDLGEAAARGAFVEDHEGGLRIGFGSGEGLAGPAEDLGVEGADAGEVDGGDFDPRYCADLGVVNVRAGDYWAEREA